MTLPADQRADTYCPACQGPDRGEPIGETMTMVDRELTLRCRRCAATWTVRYPPDQRPA